MMVSSMQLEQYGHTVFVLWFFPHLTRSASGTYLDLTTLNPQFCYEIGSHVVLDIWTHMFLFIYRAALEERVSMQF